MLRTLLSELGRKEAVPFLVGLPVAVGMLAPRTDEESLGQSYYAKQNFAQFSTLREANKAAAHAVPKKSPA